MEAFKQPSGAWWGVGTVVTALTITLFALAPARGDAIPSQIGYSTSGWISAPWASGPISFQGLSNATLESSSPFPLGQFVIATQPGVSTTYTDTPFAIDFTAPQFHRVVGAPDTPGAIPHQYDGIFEVQGHLDGMVSSNGHSTVVATFDGVYPYQSFVEMTTDRVYLNGLPFSTSEVQLPETLVLDTGASGEGAFGRANLTVTAQIVPEPSSYAIFLLAILGSFWSLRRINAAS
jgi:hypothetical protein